MAESHVNSFEDVRGWLAEHDRISNLTPFKTLGRFHNLIDSADLKFWKSVHEEKPTGIGRAKRLELTAFGREVGGDSPRWWVLSREAAIAELWNDTKLAFLAAQTLLQDRK